MEEVFFVVFDFLAFVAFVLPAVLLVLFFDLVLLVCVFRDTQPFSSVSASDFFEDAAAFLFVLKGKSISTLRFFELRHACPRGPSLK